MSFQIAVAGGIQLNLIAHAEETLNPRDSNPAQIKQTFGGVGLNIARNLKLLDQEVALISAFSTDPAGQAMKRYCQSLQFDLRATADTEDFPSATYVAMHHPDGNLAMAMYDMRIYDELDPKLNEQAARLLQDMDALIIETNFNEKTLLDLIQNRDLPIICDPVSHVKTPRIQWLLPFITLLKPNRYEAEQLTERIIETPEDALSASRQILERGVRICCLSLGGQGLVISDREQSCYLRGSVYAETNSAGAGDAMTAALTIGLLEQMTVPELGRLAMAAATLTLEADEPVNVELNRAELNRRAAEFEIVPLPEH